MIKAAGQAGDGTPLLILGLSGENMTRLMAREPISFDTAELGLPPMRVIIVGGRTENDISRELIGHGLLQPEADRAAPPSFTCPCCGAVSCNPNDIEQGYCGRCHAWTGDPELGPAHLAGPCPERKVPG